MGGLAVGDLPAHNDKMDDRDQVGAAYLDHLTDADLRELAHAGEVSAAEADARIRALRGSPGLVLDVLDRPAVSGSLLSIPGPEAGKRFTLISPFLVFAAAIHRIAADVAVSGYAPERTGPRLRVPVFDGPQLSDYLSRPGHRLYLAELLASFARSSGGVIVTRTARGTHRRRWNDLDLGRLAMLLAALPEQDRLPVLRRLGDLAMFLSGVFPAAIERALAGRLEPARLARTTGLPPPDGGLPPAELFEWFGAGWYRLAASRLAGSAAAGLARTALASGERGITGPPPGARHARDYQPGSDQSSAGQSSSGGQHSAGQSPVGQHSAGQSSAGQSSAGQSAAGQFPGGEPWSAVGAAMAGSVSGAALRDSAEHFHVARRVLNAAADRYLFPAGIEWFTPPG
jgi:hypothetical protein